MTLPDTRAALSIAELIGQHLSPRWLTEECLQQIAAKVVAHRAAVIEVFADLEGDPRRLGAQTDIQLQQQRRSSLTDAEVLEEEIHWLVRELDAKRAMLVRALHGRPPEHDPDERDADREDDKAREQRQDARADREAPRP